MVDIPITAAVVGGQQAVADLDKLSQKTKQAAAATQQNADALRRQNGELQRTAATARRYVTASAAVGGAGRVGGAIGGVLGLSGLGTLGAGIAAGFAVVNTGTQALAAALESSVGAIRAEETARLAVSKAIIEGRKTERAGALAWADANGQGRLGLIALGGEGLARQADRMSAKGITDAAGGVGALARAGMATNSNLSSVEVAARTGLVTATEAAQQVIDGARSAEEVLSGALGRMITGGDLEQMLANAGGSRLGGHMAEVARLRARGEDIQRLRFESGDGVKAAKSQLDAIIDPAGEAAKALLRESTAQTTLLEGMYERMGIWERVADVLVNRDRSVAAEANRAARDRAAIAGAIPVGAGF